MIWTMLFQNTQRLLKKHWFKVKNSKLFKTTVQGIIKNFAI
jgi:hypothetical protein